MDFKILKLAVAKQFDLMTKQGVMFRTAVSKDELWTTYLSSFPEGTNPMFRERTEHDCNCCKQFIRAVGDAVALVNGKLVSIWDISIPKEPGYQAVADALAAKVKSYPIEDMFLHYEGKAGTDKSFEQRVGNVQTWDHFYVTIPRQFVVNGKDIATKLGQLRSTRDVLQRALTELTDDSIETVLEMIEQRSLYRGDEHTFVLKEFQKLKRAYASMSAADRDVFAWTSTSASGAVAHIRNSAIGTLLVDLSEGKDLEAAVGAYEFKVAPANYKRPTALVTKGMIEKAQAKIAELRLTSALGRRFATVSDITINNILFADRSTRKVMAGDVFDELAAAAGAKAPKNLDRVEEVSIEDFIKRILPKAESLEVMFDNTHSANLVSLVAPTDPTAGNLFKWSNNFSWSYNGEMADSIKERVKQAGGNVTGDLCCRLAWYNHDDLDFHMIEPGGHEIYFGSRGRKSPSGGDLDVDMNAGHGTTRTPVENIAYASRATMKEGEYKLFVHNFCNRDSTDPGFEVEMDFMGEVRKFAYPQALPSKKSVTVIRFKYSRKTGIEVLEALPSTTSSKVMWGIPSQTFHKVNMMMLSPNYWDDRAVGNKHYFFILDGCFNDGSVRGFFNEFLKEELNPHRKVFEVVGSKMKVPASADQLSGLGFSSTQRNSVLCRVKGSFTRIIKINF